MNEYVTRAEFEQAKQDLRADIRDTERQLRGEFVTAIESAKRDLGGKIDDVDAHLSTQDEMLERRFAWPALSWPTIKYTLLGLGVVLVSHFVFHVG